MGHGKAPKQTFRGVSLNGLKCYSLQLRMTKKPHIIPTFGLSPARFRQGFAP